MLLADIDPISFANIMERITTYPYAKDTSSKTPTSDTKPSDNSETKTTLEGEQSTLLDYLSTHPNTDERIKQAKHYAQCYEKGLRGCDGI